MKKEKILLAGATGYLGGYIAKRLKEEGYSVRLIVRNKKKVNFNDQEFEVYEGQVTEPASISKAFEGVDVVISTVGITRQKDGLTYMDVDYQANVNLVDAAKVNGVRKFIYVSVFRGDQMRHLQICAAKERMVDYLKASDLKYCIIRPNGFFSDMGDFLDMAKGGRVYLFGDGKLKLNPIHGADLAKECVRMVATTDQELNIGGPEVLSQNEIARFALKALAKQPKITHLPDWVRKMVLWFVRTFLSAKTYGPIEFFLSAMVMDMVAPQYGTHKLEDYFLAKAKVE
ncbi:SDR family oxidoreductase [Limibacter armeniacum]|uniref:SDR family oxidoreductase n=1 Tax=Limibacter armeniacum TaxID=466084 RepID=UPI002FE693C6